jgi:hypothetical protein
LSTWAINKQSANSLNHRVIAYVLVTLACVAVDNIYALFGHGIRSDSMDFMFLYPLCGGLLWFLAATAKHRHRFERAGFNLFNSGVAALTAAALLRGIVQIAGGSSAFPAPMAAAGGIMAAFGYALMLIRA